MIVDDSEDDRYLLKRHLSALKAQCSIVEVSNGAEAIDYLADADANRKINPVSFPPQLVFLDINMPIMDAWGFLDRFAKLRHQIHIKETGVVLFTTSQLDHERARADTYGFITDYLVKGEYTKECLKEILQRSIQIVA